MQPVAPSLFPKAELASDVVPMFLSRALIEASMLRQMSSDARGWSKPHATHDRCSHCRGGGSWLKPSSRENP